MQILCITTVSTGKAILIIGMLFIRCCRFYCWN